MASRAAEPSGNFRFRRLEKPEEYRTAEELQRIALADDDALTIPASVLRSWQDTGGIVLGAFADIYLAGVAVSSLGWDGRTLYHQAQIVAVRPEYQNHRVGRRLLGYLRDEVLGLGLPEVRGSFDPLQSRSAELLVHRLGVRPDAYLSDYFGRRREGSSNDTETDRLRFRWTLADPAVEHRLSSGPPAAEELRSRWASANTMVETGPGESGVRLPTAVAEPDQGPATLEVPFDLALVRAHEGREARRWRRAVRDAFRIAFDLGYTVDEFTVVSVDHERRAFYLLSPRPPETAP